jgi:hypothetical protein
MRFEITARSNDQKRTRTFEIDAVDIDDAAIVGIAHVSDDETVVQVRDSDYDEAAAIFALAAECDSPYRIEVGGDVAYADSLDAALYAAYCLVEESAEGVDDRAKHKDAAVIYHVGQKSIYATALARRGCIDEAAFYRQEIHALAGRSHRA